MINVKNKKRVIFNFIAILCVILFIRLYIDNNVIEITEISVVDDEIPTAFDNVKIVHISDLHNKNYGEDENVLLEKIDEIAPDYIFLTGDMVSSKDTDFTPFYNLAYELGNKYECYYIYGNHELDLKNDEWKDIKQKLEELSIHVLDNTMVTLSREGEEIYLYGMWYNPKYYIREEFTLTDMEKIMGTSQDGYNILLTHNPDDFEVYADWGADLTFSGHVHGGMIRLPFVGGIISPNRTLFPVYDSGLYVIDTANMIVSRGLSRGQTGIRFLNQPELIIVTLEKAD